MRVGTIEEVPAYNHIKTIMKKSWRTTYLIPALLNLVILHLKEPGVNKNLMTFLNSGCYDSRGERKPCEDIDV